MLHYPPYIIGGHAPPMMSEKEDFPNGLQRLITLTHGGIICHIQGSSNHRPWPHQFTYLLVFEGLHQFGRLTEGHGEGEVGSVVTVGYLDAFVAEVPLPFRIMDHVVLAEYMRDETPWGETGKTERRGRGNQCLMRGGGEGGKGA